MAPNLLHIVTSLQQEVQDGTDPELPAALPPHNMGTIRCNYAHQLGVQLRCSKKKAGGVNVECVFLRFCGRTHHTLDTGMCLASCRRLEMNWDTAFRALGQPHVRALSFRRFPTPVPTLAQQCATSPSLRTGRMQDVREPMRASTRKYTIANKWARNGSYWRLQFQHLPHEPNIMTFPSPFFKKTNFVGVPPISMPTSASSFLICFNLLDLVVKFPRGIYPLQMGHIVPHIENPPMPGHHGVAPYPPVGPQTSHSVWRWHHEKQWLCKKLLQPNVHFPHTSECWSQHGHMQPSW